MRASAKQNASPPAPPGIVATARVGRRAGALVPRLRPGDIAVLDHPDLDRSSAQALVESGIAAVLNAGPFISGRYPNLGPELLAQAGIELVDQIGEDGLAAIKDGVRVRLDDGVVYLDDRAIAGGRPVGLDQVIEEMAAARVGLAAQLESFTHNSTEFLRREQDVLLHDEGAPTLSTKLSGRPVVVVVRAHDHDEELARVASYLKDQRPVLVGVDRGADALLEAGHRPDIVVVTGQRRQHDNLDLVSARALKAARDVVLVLDRGASRHSTDQLDRLGIRASRFETGATAEDAALLLAHLSGASLIVGVGMHATLDEFLDRQRDGLASTYLTRLKVGPRLVDARAVPQLYSGVVHPRHLALLLLAGLVALAAAIGTTPVGQDWAQHLLDRLQGLFS
jgi:uncharacterized membrane-anchored protein